MQRPNTLQALGNERTVVLKRGLDGHYRAEALLTAKKSMCWLTLVQLVSHISTCG
jgi:hypothetical protein